MPCAFPAIARFPPASALTWAGGKWVFPGMKLRSAGKPRETRRRKWCIAGKQKVFPGKEQATVRKHLSTGEKHLSTCRQHLPSDGKRLLGAVVQRDWSAQRETARGEQAGWPTKERRRASR